MFQRFFISIIIVCALLCGLVYYLHNQTPAYDLIALIAGNIALAAISVISFTIINNGIKSDKAQAFVRAKMSATMLKFFMCIGLLLAYIFINNRQVHKPSLFLFIGMYVVYSAIEAVPLSKLARQKK